MGQQQQSLERKDFHKINETMRLIRTKYIHKQLQENVLKGIGYHGILVGLESVPSDEEAKTFAGLTEMTSAQKKKFNNYKLNIRAYADLLQCCTQAIISFGIFDAAKDKELSNCNSKLAWKLLSEKFAG